MSIVIQVSRNVMASLQRGDRADQQAGQILDVLDSAQLTIGPAVDVPLAEGQSQMASLDSDDSHATTEVMDRLQQCEAVEEAFFKPPAEPPQI